ncbi:hypothetical protein H0H93_013820, partial [Arthromyces matolae]
RSGPLPKVGISRAIPRRLASKIAIPASPQSDGASASNDPRLSNQYHFTPTSSPHHRSSSAQAVHPTSSFPSTTTTNPPTTPYPN